MGRETVPHPATDATEAVVEDLAPNAFVRLRRFCVALASATEQIQWGDDLVMKVGGKMFAVFGGAGRAPDAHVMSLKCSDADFDRLTALPGIDPAPYLARAKWVALESYDALPIGEVEALLRRAHELVAAKLPVKVRASLGTAPRSEPAPRDVEDDVPSMRDLMREEGAAVPEPKAPERRPVRRRKR